jgi:hypothetical protein
MIYRRFVSKATLRPANIMQRYIQVSFQTAPNATKMLIFVVLLKILSYCGLNKLKFTKN